MLLGQLSTKAEFLSHTHQGAIHWLRPSPCSTNKSLTWHLGVSLPQTHLANQMHPIICSLTTILLRTLSWIDSIQTLPAIPTDFDLFRVNLKHVLSLPWFYLIGLLLIWLNMALSKREHFLELNWTPLIGGKLYDALNLGQSRD